MSTDIANDYRSLQDIQAADVAVAELALALHQARQHRHRLATSYLAHGTTKAERRARQKVLGGIIRETSRT